MTALPLRKLAVTITIFGCGRMAGAMLSRWLDVGLLPAQVTAVRETRVSVAPGVATHVDANGLSPPDILVIGIKPQQFTALSAAIAPLAGPQTLVLSILAGVPMERLAEAFPDAASIIRLMPNLPVATGSGVVARLGDAAVHDAALTALLNALGHVQPVADERAFDLVTALAGCGPAFTYRFAAALAAAGERLGLSATDAAALARLTLSGAATTIAASSETLAELADAVASPGGMTQAGLDVLDGDGALVQLMTDTLRAARDRGAELAVLAQG